MPTFYNRAAQCKKRKLFRNNSTPAERFLWQFLKGRAIDGYKFRRQFGIGTYIVDFYCPAARLAVELDGAVHESPEMKMHDEERNKILEANWIRTIRFKNAEALYDTKNVLSKIRNAIHAPPDARRGRPAQLAGEE